MIDLRKDIVLVDEFLKTSVEKFRSDVAEPSWIGIYSDPVSGWVTLYFDTSQDLHIDNQYSLGLEHPEYSTIDFASWHDTYWQSNDPEHADRETSIVSDKEISLVDHTGNHIFLKGDFDDAEFYDPFFRMLLASTHKYRQETNSYRYIVEILGGSHFEII